MSWADNVESWLGSVIPRAGDISIGSGDSSISFPNTSKAVTELYGSKPANMTDAEWQRRQGSFSNYTPSGEYTPSRASSVTGGNDDFLKIVLVVIVGLFGISIFTR